MTMTSKASGSGLFELYAEVVVEGDCCTPTRVHYNRIAEYATSEALARGVEEHEAMGLTYFEVRYPKAYLARMTKLAKIRSDRRNTEALNSDVPF